MIVLVDIDHTMSDAKWRDHLIESSKASGSWDDYHELGKDDKPIPEIVSLIIALRDAGHTVVGSTARPEKWRRLTMEWAATHSIPLDIILMREPGDFRPSPEVKIANALNSGLWPDLVIDDRPDVLEAFREEGVPTLMANVCVHSMRAT